MASLGSSEAFLLYGHLAPRGTGFAWQPSRAARPDARLLLNEIMVPRNQPEGRRAGDAGSGPWEGPHGRARRNRAARRGPRHPLPG